MNRNGTYFICAAVAILIVMFATRLETLSFGRVFPVRSAEDVKKIEVLEQKIKDLDVRTADLALATARIQTLEQDNRDLRAKVRELEDRPPQVLLKEVPLTLGASPPAQEVSSESEDKTETSGDSSDVVRRGDNMAKVRRVFGRPTKVLKLSDEESWYYDGGLSKEIVFKDGLVSEWDNMPVEP